MYKKRNKIFDITKGIGIFLIVWGHEVCPFLSQLLLFHVPLFIIISGMLYRPQPSFKLYLNKKIHSLLLPYIQYLFIGLLVWLCYNYNHINNNNLKYILNINYPRINGPIWFLLSLFWINILYFFLNLIRSQIIKNLVITSIVIISITMIICEINYLFITQALLMILFYHVGFTYKKLIANMEKRVIITTLLVFTIGIYLTSTKQYGCETVNLIIGGNIVYYYIFGISGSILTIYISKIISKYKYSKVISYVGKNSLLILGLHFILVIPINSFYKEKICNLHLFAIFDFLIKILYSVLMPIATIIIILFFNKIYKIVKSKVHKTKIHYYLY